MAEPNRRHRRMTAEEMKARHRARPEPSYSLDGYKMVGPLRDGMRKVSTLRLELRDLASYTEFFPMAGTWGFVEANGKPVIKPQYIYAYDFCNGVAVVCRGEWRNDKYDNGYGKSLYWSDEEIWGVIDKSGNAVIPFVFDELESFGEAENRFFRAHYGGWKTGGWGVLDAQGDWVVEPVYGEIGDECRDGLFVFCNKRITEKGALWGVYDFDQRRVLFEPQFRSAYLLRCGLISVFVVDGATGKPVCKTIDRYGNETEPPEDEYEEGAWSPPDT